MKKSIPDELYKFLPEGVVIKNKTNPNRMGSVVKESELREGELHAEIYQVGCYSVRIADRIYRNSNSELTSDDEIKLEGKGIKQEEAVIAQSADIPPFKSRYSRPATKEELEEYLNALFNFLKTRIAPFYEYQWVEEISVAYMDGEYKNVCQLTEAKRGSHYDKLTFIGTIKLNESVLDSNASLLIGRECVVNSSTDEYCYIFSPDGYIIPNFARDMEPKSLNTKLEWL